MQRKFFGTSERRGSEVNPAGGERRLYRQYQVSRLDGANHARGCAARSGRHPVLALLVQRSTIEICVNSEREMRRDHEDYSKVETTNK
jgi:hypothetical protein